MNAFGIIKFIRKVLVLFFFIFCIISCNKKESKYYPKEVCFPKSLQPISKAVDLEVFLSNKLKIINYVNLECSVCFKLLKDWKKYYEQNSFIRDIPIIFILYGNYNDVFSYYFENLGEYPFPVLYDSSYLFFQLNQIPNLEYYKTILINQDNKIEIIGNPFDFPEMSIKYESLVKKIQNE